jgi:hypothetical protein
VQGATSPPKASGVGVQDLASLGQPVTPVVALLLLINGAIAALAILLIGRRGPSA